MQMKYSKISRVVVGLLWVVALLNYMDRQFSTMQPSMQIDIVELHR